MMKIGILTHFHNSTNYGGVLQAYALCKYLNDRGYSAEQILYKHHAIKVCNSQVTYKDLFKKFKLRLTKELYRRKNADIRKKMESAFKTFRESVPHTKHAYTIDTVGAIADDYDVLIAGSDQVWNPIWYDPAYMLHFASKHTRKLSYAASIGINVLDDKQKQIFCNHLCDFEGISVREQSAADILSPLIGKEVNVCVDPTLLLTKNEWDEIASKRKIKEEYAFLYFLGDDMRSRKAAELFAAQKGLKVITIPDLSGKYRKIDRKINAEYVDGATPEDFISLIKHAEYIFTDSFHACVFSILYNKNFFVFQRPGKINMESRIYNLMELFECQERFFVDDYNVFDDLLLLGSIDYQREFKKFTLAKQKSVQYLQNVLYE